MAEKSQELIYDSMCEKIIEVAEKIATQSGVNEITVRKILVELGITNRVFYNRFHNIEEVLNIVYENTVLKIRKGITEDFDPESNYFEGVINIVANTLRLSYENKMHFNQYVFENDSVLQNNFEWWKKQIASIIELGKKKGYLKNIDTDIMSYSIWCFIRGYNADALGRGLPLEKAVSDFKYSFCVLIDGMKA